MTLDQFPSPAELWHRYRVHKGLVDEHEDTVLQDHFFESGGKKPRYYQRVAINRVVEAAAKGDDRLLLVMANPQLLPRQICGLRTRLRRRVDVTSSGEASWILFATPKTASKTAKELGLRVHAGHGLDYGNVWRVAALPEVEELNIGFAIIARSLFVGLTNATREMRDEMLRAREVANAHA